MITEHTIIFLEGALTGFLIVVILWAIKECINLWIEDKIYEHKLDTFYKK